jgi:membrane protein implicated in regulation of membrane protease activity
MTKLDWNVIYTRLYGENKRQILYYRTLTWILPPLCLLPALVLWLISSEATTPFAFFFTLAGIALAISNGWVWFRLTMRPLTLVEGTIAKKFTERDGQRGSTAKLYFLRVQSATVHELTPQGLGAMCSEGKTKKVRCTRNLSEQVAQGADVRLLVLPDNVAIGYIKGEQAVYPPFAGSFVQQVLATFLQARQ